MTPKGVLFLDIDGVLCTHRVHAVFGRHGRLMRALDPVGIAWINKLCAQYNLEIVICSVWRYDHASSFPYRPGRGVRRDAKGYLQHCGMVAPFHADWKTPRGNIIRGDDLVGWFRKNGRPPRMIIIDDSTDYHGWQKEFLVVPDGLNGIRHKDMAMAERILRSQPAKGRRHGPKAP